MIPISTLYMEIHVYYHNTVVVVQGASFPCYLHLFYIVSRKGHGHPLCEIREPSDRSKEENEIIELTLKSAQVMKSGRCKRDCHLPPFVNTFSLPPPSCSPQRASAGWGKMPKVGA